MKRKKSKKAVLILEDGTIFYGKCSGKEGTGLGEICFNTGNDMAIKKFLLTLLILDK